MDRTRAVLGVASQHVRRHRADYQIVLFMGLLMLLGLIVMYAIGPQRAHVLNISYNTDYSGTYFFTKQAISLGFALIVFWVLSKVSYQWLQKHAWHLVLIALGACAVLALAGWTHIGVAQCSLGACRWFDLGPLGSLQPAEFLKFALLMYIAGLLGARHREGRVNDWEHTLIPLGVLFAVASLFIIIIQKDMGTGLSLVALVAAMLVAAGLNKRIGLALVVIATVATIAMIVIAPHRLERISAFFAGDSASVVDNPENYHINNAKIAIGSGGLTGLGIGNSVQATGYLPEPTNDSVFAIMGETFGFVGLVTILSLFSALLLRILRVADHLTDMSSRLIAVGVFGWLGAHVVLNVAAMTGILPLTGITLPLLSFGGTSMVFIAGALGIVFQLSQYTTNSIRIEEGANHEDSRSRRGLGRSRYADRSSY